MFQLQGKILISFFKNWEIKKYMVVNILGIPRRNQNLPEVKNRTSHPDWACTSWVLTSAPCKISQCVRHPHWNSQKIIFIDIHITWWSYNDYCFCKAENKKKIQYGYACGTDIQIRYCTDQKNSAKVCFMSKYDSIQDCTSCITSCIYR